MTTTIRQLYDDLAPFYPITSAEAVVGGSITEGSKPTVVDLSYCIHPNFKLYGTEFIKLFKYNEIMSRIVVEVSKLDAYAIQPGKNLIAEAIPVTYIPDMPIVMKTLTDDPRWKAAVVFDIDGNIYLYATPYEEMTTDVDIDLKKHVVKKTICSMINISATSIILK